MADEKAAEPQPKGKKHRSPRYPAIALGQAIEKAKIIFQNDGKNEAAESTIFQHWGYKSRSGPALVTAAALKYFGLLAPGRRSGTYRLSDLALKILIDEREDRSEYDAALQEAALKPAIHAEVWEKYGAALPSDATLKFYLRNEKDFTDGGANQFIAEYKATLAFSGLATRGTLSSAGEDQVRREETPSMDASVKVIPKGAAPPTPLVPLTPGMKEIPIPIPGATWPYIKAAFPLSEDAWGQMLEVLKAMKPGLVAASTKEEKPTEE